MKNNSSILQFLYSIVLVLALILLTLMSIFPENICSGLNCQIFTIILIMILAFGFALSFYAFLRSSRNERDLLIKKEETDLRVREKVIDYYFNKKKEDVENLTRTLKDFERVVDKSIPKVKIEDVNSKIQGLKNLYEETQLLNSIIVIDTGINEILQLLCQNKNIQTKKEEIAEKLKSFNEKLQIADFPRENCFNKIELDMLRSKTYLKGKLDEIISVFDNSDLWEDGSIENQKAHLNKVKELFETNEYAKTIRESLAVFKDESGKVRDEYLNICLEVKSINENLLRIKELLEKSMKELELEKLLKNVSCKKY